MIRSRFSWKDEKGIFLSEGSLICSLGRHVGVLSVLELLPKMMHLKSAYLSHTPFN